MKAAGKPKPPMKEQKQEGESDEYPDDTIKISRDVVGMLRKV